MKRVLCLCALLSWSWQSLATSLSEFGTRLLGVDVSLFPITVEGCGKSEKIQPRLYVLENIPQEQKYVFEDIPQNKENFSIIIGYSFKNKMIVRRAVMGVRGSNVYTAFLDHAYYGSHKIHKKIGSVISNDASGLVLEADFGTKLAFKINITGETAIVDVKKYFYYAHDKSSCTTPVLTFFV